MRILFAIPHFCSAESYRDKHGSGRGEHAFRAAALEACLAAMHENLGNAQCTFDLARPAASQANACTGNHIDIVICTTRGSHILTSISANDAVYEHRECDVEPRMLGFECHRTLRERIDGYDYFCYCEDDLLIHDGWFFRKLEAFSERFGIEYVLMPNRYERSRKWPYLKGYIDGPLHPSFLAALRQPSSVKQEIFEYLDLPLVVRRAANPHSGCFFLRRDQLLRWSKRKYWLDRDASFVSPLESAATLGIAKTFSIFKPSPRSANFFEVEHCGRAYLERLIARGLKGISADRGQSHVN